MRWVRIKLQASLLAALLLTGLWISGSFQRRAKAQSDEILVSAAVSLKESFTEIGSLYEHRTGNRVTFSFGASGELEKQIEAGAPVDVFASAGQQEMDRLQAKGLLEPGSRANFTRNALVLIVPSDSKSHLQSFATLSRADVRKIAIGDPKTVPAGVYARQLLDKMGLWPQVESRLVFAENVRQVLDYVMRGEVDAGIVYATDVAVAGGRVAVAAQAPEGEYGPILYPVAVIKDGSHARAARPFVDLVLAPEGTEILRKHGFLAVN